MKNLLAATQSAVFRALRQLQDDNDLTTLLGQPVRVFTHIEQGTLPPYIKIGQLSSTSEAEGYDQVERISVEVYGVFRGEGNIRLLSMLHAARIALDGQYLVSDDAQIQPPEYQTAEISEAIDNDLYVGMMSFEMLVEPS